MCYASDDGFSCSALGEAVLFNSAPYLKSRERNRKNSPVVNEIEKSTSYASAPGDINRKIPRIISAETAWAAEMMIEAIPRRKISFALSKVKGSPTLRTRPKYRFARKAKIAPPAQLIRPIRQAGYERAAIACSPSMNSAGALANGRATSAIKQPAAPTMQRIKTTSETILTTLKIVKIVDNVLLMIMFVLFAFIIDLINNVGGKASCTVHGKNVL